ncbi:AMP-binding protein [Streptomyces sp. ISL-44]|uniref:AMP-binding protein n=1 Tax=Streptomyces sp. ISL-44 TaxID=2819184 RepID=UPI0027E2C937|nr:AMP-binding protein [Streptomyces sp. ISL-44]
MKSAGTAAVRTARSLADGILAQARRSPGATALVWREQEIGYGALLHRAEEERARLARIPAGSPLGVPAVKSPAVVALVLAALLERRPVLLPSPQLGAEVTQRLYAQAGVEHVLGPLDTPFEESAPAGRFADAAPPSDRAHALLLTTSGSTGTPKIVPLRAGALDRFTRWAADSFGIGPGTIVLNYAPLNFDLCLLDVWTTLAHGGRVVLADTDRATQGGYLLDLVLRHRPEIVQAVPLFYRLLADAARERGAAVPGVRHALFTGDALPAPLRAELPALLPGARLYNLYGCTETNDSFLYELTGGEDPALPLPLGSPLPGAGALLVDADHGVLEGPGTGELYVTTPFQTEGYLGAAAASAVFTDHPAGADGCRWFHSGDLVTRSDDGTLRLAGRTDFQVKVRGVRINPQETEHVLLEHPSVLEAAVLALPDPVAGRLLHAVARRAPGSGLNSLTLRGHLARGLPRAAVPSVLRITDGPLPRTSTGKVDRDQVARTHFTKEN